MALSQARHPGWRKRLAGRTALRLPGVLGWLGMVAGAVAVLPLVGVVAAAASGPAAGIAPADLWRYGLTSAWLALLVGSATAVLGTLAAWLVVMHRFPGRDLFGWALALPLAMPAFAMAYAYSDLFDPAGALRIWLRAGAGFDWPFEPRTVAGAAFVLSCAFYPYVYLSMRAAFVAQSAAALEAARMLGCSRRAAFWRVALPLARPALAAGVALAMMETLADYGAVRFLSVQTLTTGVVRAWSVFGTVAGAAQLALPLLAAAALLLWLERSGRRGVVHERGQVRLRPLEVLPLHGLRGWAASGFCAALLTAGLLLPAGWLLASAWAYSPELTRLLVAARHSLLLALAGAVLTTLLGLALALGAARAPFATRLASLGYATPGAAMAIGLLAPAALVWQMSSAGAGTLTGIALLLYAYAARLMAAALEPIEAGLARVTPSMIGAARLLGRSEAGAAASVQVPLARGALLTAGLVVFIDILKELPATLILRPFNFDTLAVIANAYALDERLGQAGWPALLITALALPPTIILSRRIAAARPGA